MAFVINCSNKGCGEMQAPYLDKDDMSKVYCSSCHREINNISPIFKNQMKMNKQFKQKERKPFAVKCLKCNTEDKPSLIKGEVVCSFCNEKMDNLTPSFILMLKSQLGNRD